MDLLRLTWPLLFLAAALLLLLVVEGQSQQQASDEATDGNQGQQQQTKPDEKQKKMSCSSACKPVGEDGDEDEEEHQCTVRCPLEIDPLPMQFRMDQLFFKGDPRNLAGKPNGTVPFAFEFCRPPTTGTAAGYDCDTDAEQPAGFLACFKGELDPGRQSSRLDKWHSVANILGNGLAKLCVQGRSQDDEVNGLIEAWQSVNGGTLHALHVSAMPNGLFRVQTSFSQDSFYYKVGAAECLRLVLFTAESMFSQFFSVAAPPPPPAPPAPPAPNPQQQNSVAEDGKTDEEKAAAQNGVNAQEEQQPKKNNSNELADQNQNVPPPPAAVPQTRLYHLDSDAKRMRTKRVPQAEMLMNGQTLDSECFRGPWLLGMDMFLQFNNFYLKTARLGAVEQCVPTVTLSSDLLVPPPPEECDKTKDPNCADNPPAADGDQQSVWEVATEKTVLPAHLNGRVHFTPNGVYQDGKLKFVFKPSGPMTNLNFAMPRADQVEFIIYMTTVVNTDCFKERDEQTCANNKNIIVFDLNQQQKQENDAQCQLTVARLDAYRCCLGVESTNTSDTVSVLNNEEMVHIFINDNRISNWNIYKGTVVGEARLKARLPDQCAVQNVPIHEFGQVHGATQPFVAQLSFPTVKLAEKCEDQLTIYFDKEYELLVPKAKGAK